MEPTSDHVKKALVFLLTVMMGLCLFVSGYRVGGLECYKLPRCVAMVKVIQANLVDCLEAREPDSQSTNGEYCPLDASTDNPTCS